MRIIAGRHRGTQLASVGKGDLSAHLRPTTDRVRENLFNLLQGGRFGAPLNGTKVLDLFAGTGALGLEALSRGAAQVTFVDNGAAAAKLISQNIRKLQRENDTQLIKADANRLPMGQPHDLIFCDPPYGKDMGATALAHASRQGWCAKDALAVIEDRAAVAPPTGFTVLDQKRYGDTWLTFLRHSRPEV